MLIFNINSHIQEAVKNHKLHVTETEEVTHMKVRISGKYSKGNVLYERVTCSTSGNEIEIVSDSRVGLIDGTSGAWSDAYCLLIDLKGTITFPGHISHGESDRKTYSPQLDLENMELCVEFTGNGVCGTHILEGCFTITIEPVGKDCTNFVLVDKTSGNKLGTATVLLLLGKSVGLIGFIPFPDTLPEEKPVDVLSFRE
jgi:hypothetical protein